MSDKTLSTQPYKGTRDFYPTDMKVREFMFDRVRKTLKSFGYQEYDGPMLEPFELYAAKTSEEIVNEQLYWLVDRGERKLAIRPEMTPTLARMVAAKQNELPKPIRWFSIPNLWRYERPQRGRLREHWQVNVDVLGGGDPLAEDSEICQVAVAILEGFGATGSKAQYEIRLNHRAITNALFQDWLKIPAEKTATVGRLLDAAPKMGPEGFEKALVTEGLDAGQITKLLGLLGPDAAAKLEKELSGHAAFQHLNTLFAHLEALGIGQRFRFDPSLMRGFMYYTGMVLEVFDLHPENNRALFGGGRYDNLVGMFGGKPLPGVGFGMGDVTLKNFLETHQLLPQLAAPQGLYIAHFSEAEFTAAQALARELREKTGIAIRTALEPQKPKKAFPTAEKLGSKFILFVGSEETKNQKYQIKELVSGQTTEGGVSEIAAFLKING